jgi:tetratricopeptide (TPR) repeat protein
MARRDFDGARRDAALAQQADPALPLPTYVEALILHGAGRYAEALQSFQATIKQLEGQSITIQDLYYYTGDTLGRLGEGTRAEAAFRIETRLSPANTKAHAALAMIYRAGGRPAEAEEAIRVMLQNVPTSEGYAMAIRLWAIFGEPARAAALRKEAVARFGEASISRDERRLLPAAPAERVPRS